ncbi:MAG: porphobilinogen synthase, partial [Candidatus Desulforudis sp.]|nr:porphobilinogen synthase [Desulforudis sp.]
MKIRMRRLRQGPVIRRLVRETRLDLDDLIYPVFVTEGRGVVEPVAAMPGVHRYSVDTLPAVLDEVVEAGVPGIIVFGVPDVKDDRAGAAYAPDGVVQRGVAAVKARHPELLVITDVCLCAYTGHGHCGLVENGVVLNDPSVALLAQTALSHVRAGADVVAPSDMMDGRVGAIRELLDAEGCEHVPIMSYAAKYASAFYGPFR